MRYGSVCSGIEAATVAWHPLDWQPAFFAEIEKFPSAVLAHRYPGVPNWGDITKFKEWPDACHCVRLGAERRGQGDRTDNLRHHPADDPNAASCRSNLSGRFRCEKCGGATIDVLVGGTPCQSFSVAGLRQGLADPRGNLCLTFLAIADRYRPQWLLWENVPGVLSSDGGRDFGAFLGGLGQLGYGWSYRVLDAQYVRVDGFERAVPQRRRRVFVVGYLGDYRRAAAVLFERESLSGHPAPRRQAGQRSAVAVAPCLRAGGNETGGDRPYGTDVDTRDSLIPEAAEALLSTDHKDPGHNRDHNFVVAHALTTSHGTAEDGTGRDTPLVPVAFDSKDLTLGSDGATSTLTTNGNENHAGGRLAIAFNGRMDPVNEPVPGAIDTDPLTTCVALQGNMIGRHDEAGPVGSGHDTSGAMFSLTKTDIHAVATNWAVRRLTPTECERLQGFPDGYTDIPWRGKQTAPDGPRYKALGNSMACNVMRWIGRRIEMVDAL